MGKLNMDLLKGVEDQDRKSVCRERVFGLV